MAYATAADLTNWLPAGTVVTEPDRRIARAMLKIDGILRTAIYATDPVTGYPTDPVVIAAVRDATCAQVEYTAEQGDETGAGATSFQSVSIGKIQLGRGYSSAGSATGTAVAVSPVAVQILINAGVLSNAAISY